ncbi:MAG: hypothetical protein JW755_11385, partial [Candidatus Aminicenantes bacterium]|nr:hypothetical protein [Candidatus Aminicenantes bacterium]
MVSLVNTIEKTPMLFDTIQNKHKPFKFISLLKTRVISVLATLLIHGIAFVLVLFFVPLVQVNLFEEEVVNVFIAPGDPLLLPDKAGIYAGTDKLESTVPEGEDSQGIAEDSGTSEGALESEDNSREDSVPSGHEKSSPSSPLVSEFRLDKKIGTLDRPESAEGSLL